MSKQDRQGVRTASELERKYNFGQMQSAQGSQGKQELVLSQLVQTVSLLTVSTNAQLEALSSEIVKLVRRINLLEDRIPRNSSAVLGCAQLGYMVLGKGE
jgi:hypothetical protein